MDTMKSDLSQKQKNVQKLCDDIDEMVYEWKVKVESDTTQSINDITNLIRIHREKDLTTQSETILKSILDQKEHIMDYLNNIERHIRNMRGRLNRLDQCENFQENNLEEIETQLKQITDYLNEYTVFTEIDVSTDIPLYILRFKTPLEQIFDSLTITDAPLNNSNLTQESDNKITIKTPPDETRLIMGQDHESTTTTTMPDKANITTSYSDESDVATASSIGPIIPKMDPEVPCPTQSNPPIATEQHHTSNKSRTISVSCPSGSEWRTERIKAANTVDLLASDGSGVFYTTYRKSSPDLIAYFYFGSKRGQEYVQQWNHSRILDIVWWNTISSFVCATDRAICTVRFNGNTFEINEKSKGNWSHIRVATNGNHLWLWINSDDENFDGIKVYDDNFRLLRTIDFNDGLQRPHVSGSTSFCITDRLTASVCEQLVDGIDRFQVNFNRLNMTNFKTRDVARSSNGTMIRTDGKNQFFVTTGDTRLYMILPNGVLKRLKVDKNSDALDVVNSQCIIVSSQTDTIQILTRISTI